MIDFNVETELLADETCVVSVAGELDMYTAPPLEHQLLAAVDNGAGRLVVDLSGCDFLDSTALGVLVKVRERLGDEEHRLLVVTEQRNVVKIFEITGLDRTFTIVPTRESALNGAAGV